MQSDIQITDLRLRLDPGHARLPFEPLVENLSIEITSAAFKKIVEQAVRMVAGRLPVEIELSSVRLVDGGAEIVTKVKRSILKAELRARLAFSAHDTETIRIRVAELDAPAWIPTQFVLEHGMSYACSRAGFYRVAGDERAIDFKPAEVLGANGVPLKLADPGAWTITPTSISLGLGYKST